MDYGSDIINISKIKDSFFIGDKISGINLDVLIQFKISHIINTCGTEILNYFESIGVEYLTLNWVESPSQILLDSNDQIVDKIMMFISESLSKGEGLLIISVKGKNRCCVVVVIYLMKKYNWDVDKCIQYIKSKKEDVEIEPYFIKQLKEYEKKLNIKTNTWNEIGNKENDENLLRNTYINGLPVKQLNSLGIDDINNIKKANDTTNKKKNIHINWAENDKLVTLNYEKDLLFQTDKKDITCHITSKPGKSSIIKNTTNNSSNNLNNPLLENNKSNPTINNNINLNVTMTKKKLKIREDVDFNKISSEYNNISPNIIKQLIENDSFYFLPSNKNIQSNNNIQCKTQKTKNQTSKLKRPSSFDNNRNREKLKKECEKNNTREISKSITNDYINKKFKSYSLNKNNMNLIQRKLYRNNNNNDISKNNNYINEQNQMKKMLEDTNHINKLLYSLNNKNRMENLINNFTNYNNNYNNDSQIKKIYSNFMNRNNICSNAFSLTNSTRHSNFIPELNKKQSKIILFFIIFSYFFR